MQARRKDGIIINDEFGFTIGKSLERREPYILGTLTIRLDAVTNEVSFFRGREKELEGIMAVARLRNEDCEQHVNCPMYETVWQVSSSNEAAFRRMTRIEPGKHGSGYLA